MIDIKRIIVQEILIRATALKDKYTDQKEAKAYWACIFSQSQEEYQELLAQADKLGNKYKDTASGPTYILDKPLGGNIRVLKVRQPDPSWPERGDVDFTVADYKNFKEKYLLNKDNFKLIPRDNFEMIELMESGDTVRVYFSNPPIEEQYKDVL